MLFFFLPLCIHIGVSVGDTAAIRAPGKHSGELPAAGRRFEGGGCQAPRVFDAEARGGKNWKDDYIHVARFCGWGTSTLT